MTYQTIKQYIMRTLNKEQQLKKGFNFMNSNTLNQREEYYEEYLRFKRSRLEEMLKEECTDNDYSLKAQNYRHALKVMDRININMLGWLKRAEEDYNEKLNRCVNKLLGFGFLEGHMMLTAYDISECHNRGLDFYIKAWDTKKEEYAGRVHARLVWVECHEKVSHWRFITTLKK